MKLASRQRRCRLLGYVCYIAGWVMIARQFGRRWGWFIPFALCLPTLADMWFLLVPEFGWSDVTGLIQNPPYYRVSSSGDTLPVRWPCWRRVSACWGDMPIRHAADTGALRRDRRYAVNSTPKKQPHEATVNRHGRGLRQLPS